MDAVDRAVEFLGIKELKAEQRKVIDAFMCVHAKWAATAGRESGMKIRPHVNCEYRYYSLEDGE